MALDDAYPTGAKQLDTTAQWESFVTSFAADGVVAGVRDEFGPYLDFGARAAGLAPGAVLIRGIHTGAASYTAVPIPAPSAQDRVDRLVLRLDRDASTAPGWVTPVVLTGTPGSSPQPPALTQTTDGIFEIPISRWTSAANGELTAFADERVLIAAGMLEFPPWARPAASPRRIGIERYTNRLLYADGAAWRLLWEDTGWVTLGIDWTSVWKGATTPAIQARKRNGRVEVHIEVTRINQHLGVTDPDGSRICTVPTSMLPTGWRYFACQFTGGGGKGGIAARLMLRDDGSIWCTAPSESVPVDRHLRQTITYMTG